MELNKDNYFSKESDLEYMSVSQFKRFIECEARALAELKGEFIRPHSNALLVGSYTHAAFESEEVFKEFEEENKDSIFKARGGKYAEFETADRMIETLKSDSTAMFAMTGDKEVIMTGELFGTKWKIKVDNINHERGFFSDLKTTKSLYDRFWSEKYNGYKSFVHHYNYILQMAIYREIIAQNTGNYYKPYIVVVTKENPPDKAVIHFDEEHLSFEMEYVQSMIEKVLQVKLGINKPKGCGKCEYCRGSKKLMDSINIDNLLD